ncbi:MAG: rhodanese-like domain-containing protein [Planctomycetota bacterium]
MKLSTYISCGLLLFVVGCNSPMAESGDDAPPAPEVPPAPVIESGSSDGSAAKEDGSSSNEETTSATTIEKVEPVKELILKPASGSEMEYTSDTLADIAKMVADGKATLLDVRSQEEWDEGHVEAAKFLSSSIIGDPAKSAEVAEFVATLDKDKPVYVHCFRGGRAMRCAKALAGSGLDVRPIKANFEDFGAAGFDVTK